MFNLTSQLTKISPPFRISICISFTISSLIFQGTGCSTRLGNIEIGHVTHMNLLMSHVTHTHHGAVCDHHNHLPTHMHESWQHVKRITSHIWTCGWVVSHIRTMAYFASTTTTSRHICKSYGQVWTSTDEHMDESCHTYAPWRSSRAPQPPPKTYARVMATYEWDNLQIWTYGWVISHIRTMAQFQTSQPPPDTYARVTATYKRVTSHIWTIHITCMAESCHTYSVYACMCVCVYVCHAYTPWRSSREPQPSPGTFSRRQRRPHRYSSGRLYSRELPDPLNDCQKLCHHYYTHVPPPHPNLPGAEEVRFRPIDWRIRLPFCPLAWSAWWLKDLCCRVLEQILES